MFRQNQRNEMHDIETKNECIIKEMISNNKNKNSKELTLEQIIHKSKFRKNIDNICHLETKLNKDLSIPTSLVNTPISAFNKLSEITHFEHFQSKRSIQSTHESNRKTSNSITARTTQSYKQTGTQILLPHQTHHNNFKTIKKDDLPLKQVKKSKQSNLASFQKPASLKSKPKKINQLLCVKGGSGNKIVNILKPLTAAQGASREFISEYEFKKYQTLFELGSQIQQKQKSQQLKSNHETIQSIKYRSYMATKYTTSKKIPQKSVQSKSYSQSKLKNKIMLPDELIKKKIENRGIKTDQKINNKIQIGDELMLAKTKRINKYQLILNINLEQQMKKQAKSIKIKNEVQLKTEEQEQRLKQKHQQIGQLKQTLEKAEDNQSTNMKKIKGFKGKKVRSTVQMKTRYFIPDFIKPSLDLIVFDKKKSDKLKTEERQNLIKRNDIDGEKENLNRTFLQVADQIMRKQKNEKLQSNGDQKPSQSQQNSCLPLQFNPQIQQKDENSQYPLQIEQQEKMTKNRRNHEGKSRNHKQKQKKSKKNFQDGQICAWNQSNQKNTQSYREAQFDLDF